MVIQQNTAHKPNIGPKDGAFFEVFMFVVRRKKRTCSFMGLLTALAVAKYGEPGGANKR